MGMSDVATPSWHAKACHPRLAPLWRHEESRGSSAFAEDDVAVLAVSKRVREALHLGYGHE